MKCYSSARRVIGAAVGIGVSLLVANPARAATPAVAGNWTPTWSDEFNTGSSNLKGWTYETGNNGGWGNGEYESYTDSASNAYVANGDLNIAAIATGTGSNETYTSARITTQNVFSQTYGLIEFRAALPAAMAQQGTGLWPAVWMMPESTFNNSTTSYGSWPTSGEMDILESNNRYYAQGSLHSGPDPDDQNTQTGYYAPANFDATQFHTYDLEWNAAANGQPGSINWYVDGNLYETQTGGWYDPAGAATADAPFDQPFALIINMAVGGSYVGGAPNLSDGTYDMQIDYIRAYTAATPEPSGALLLVTAGAAVVVGRRPRRAVAGARVAASR